ncbi:MAG: hypothetical protein ACOC33_02725 [bacterium]
MNINTEKNTVILDVYEYNRLRDFEKEIKSGKTFCIEHSNSAWGQSQTEIFNTENEVIESLVDKNKNLIDNIRELRESLVNNSPNQETINEHINHEITKFKEMSFLEIIKWWWKNKL